MTPRMARSIAAKLHWPSALGFTALGLANVTIGEGTWAFVHFTVAALCGAAAMCWEARS